MTERRFLQTLATTTSLSVLCLVAFNIAVDPYQLLDAKWTTRWNQIKPALAGRERVYKAHLASRPWDAIVLGTSRAEIGIDPQSPAFRGLATANLASSNQPYRESLEILSSASGTGTRVAIIGLDFFAANAWLPYPPTYTPETYTNRSRLYAAASLTGLRDSFNTLRFQDPATARAGGWTLRRDGLRALGDEYISHRGGHRALATASESSYLRSSYPPPAAFSLGSESDGRSELHCFSRLIELAHERRMDLRLFISPSHARQWETLAEGGLWPIWETWKRRLVELNARSAKAHHATPFPLVDFSGYNSISTEPFPDPGDRDSSMRWYLESSHYRPATGNLVLAKLFHAASPMPPPDFGRELTLQTVEEVLKTIREERATWQKSHPKDVAEIQDARRASDQIRRRLSQRRKPLPDQGCTLPSVNERH